MTPCLAEMYSPAFFMATCPSEEAVIDDGAAAAREHRDDLVLDAPEHAGQIHFDRPLPLLGRQFMQRKRALLESGIVEGAVQPAISRHGMGNQPLYVTLARQIAFTNTASPPAAETASTVAFPPSSLMSVTTIFAPRRGQHQGGRPAYSAPRPRDDERLILKNSGILVFLDVYARASVQYLRGLWSTASRP